MCVSVSVGGGESKWKACLQSSVFTNTQTEQLMMPGGPPKGKHSRDRGQSSKMPFP